MSKPINRPQPTWNIDPRGVLAPMQMRVFLLLAIGKTREQIAAELKVSPKTIDTHRAAALEKLGLRHVVDAVHCALAWHLIVLPDPTGPNPPAPRLTFRITDAEEQLWSSVAGDLPLHTWMRAALNVMAGEIVKNQSKEKTDVQAQ